MKETYRKFRFRSFMSAFKFYKQYAMKTNDGQRYLERFEDRIVFNALFLADGDEQLAHDLAEEMITQRYQPATPNILKCRKNVVGTRFMLLNLNNRRRTVSRSLQSTPALQYQELGRVRGSLSQRSCSR